MPNLKDNWNKRTTDAPEEDEKEEEEETTELTWKEALSGISPIGGTLYRSFGKGLWDTVKGIPQLPSIAVALAKDLGALTKDIAGAEDGEEVINLRDYPLLAAVIEDYEERYGDEAGFKKTLREDPFAILSDILPLLAAGSGTALKVSGRAAKYQRALQATKRTAELADPTNLPGEALSGALKGTANWMEKHKPGYNPEVEVPVGRDTTTGQDITTTMRPEQAAEQFGAGTAETPVAVLSDIDRAAAIEGWQRFEGIAGAEERFEISKQAILEKRTQAVEDAAANVAELGDVRLPEVAGTRALENYNNWQLGLRGEFRQRFGAIGEVLDQPLTRIPDMELLPHTRAEVKALQASTSKLLPKPDVVKATALLEEVFEKLDRADLTLRDFDQLRTSYRDSINLAIANKEMTAIGSGTVASRLYRALTEDFYQLLEEQIALNPDAFPENFIDTVKLAKKDYLETIQLDEGVAATFLRKSQERPASIIDELLKEKSRITTEELNNLKTILGPDGWEALEPALLGRIYDLAAKRNIPTGLTAVLKRIRGQDPNRLLTLFGEETASMLVESAEFAQRFGRAETWKRGSPTAKLQQVLPKAIASGLSIPLLDEALHLLKGGGIPDLQFVDVLNILAITATWGTGKAYQNFINSPAGRDWLLEGFVHEVTIRGQTYRIDAPAMNRAADFMRKHKWALGYPARTAERATQQMEQE